jgi:predicted acyltransferase
MNTRTTQERLLSLDVFRGATIAAMILVDNPVDWDYPYSQMRHASWNGWTLTDMIFPFFLFIVGISTSLSIASGLEKGKSQTRLMFQIAKRTVILFVLGLLLTNFPHYHQLAYIRIFGVLQRIALCYFFAALIRLKTGIHAQILCTALLLFCYWIMMAFVPVPGIGAGVLEPGQNFATYIDSLVLKNHLWSNYPPWDPEGIGTTIPAVASTLFGVLTGHWLRTQHSGDSRAMGMMIAGLFLLALGQILDSWIPINKNLWSSSYSIFMAGWALICFALCHWIVDVKHYTKWSKGLAIFGMNPIAAYTLSILLDGLLMIIRWQGPDRHGIRLKFFVFDHFFALFAGPRIGSFLYSIGFMMVIFLCVWIMYRKRWFLKV